MLISPAASAQDLTKLDVQVLMTPGIANAAKIESLTDSIGVTPNGVAVVGDGDRLWAVGASGAVPVAKIHDLNSFAFSPEGLLVGVSGSNLVYLEPGGDLKDFFALPSDAMKIAPGDNDSFLLFGPEGKGEYGLYIVRPGREVIKVVSSPVPISDATQVGERLMLIAGGALYGVSNHKLLLIANEGNGALTSVAIDKSGGRVFVSDQTHILQVEKAKAVPLVNDLGGTLRWYQGGLICLDTTHKTLVRLVGLP